MKMLSVLMHRARNQILTMQRVLEVERVQRVREAGEVVILTQYRFFRVIL